MKIAIDISPLRGDDKVRGIGVMVEELVAALLSEAKKDSSITIDTIDFHGENGKRKLENGNYDIIHYPYFFPFSQTLPKKKLAKHMVVTIADLIPLVYPDNYPPGIKGKLNFYHQKRRLKNADAVLTISETSKKDICRFLKIDPNKVKVTYLAPRKPFKRMKNGKWKMEIRKKYSLPKKFVLYVGDVNYNKNISNLINACKLINVDLVIIGKNALEISGLGVDLYNIEGPRDWVRFLFNISHPELAHYKKILDQFKKSKNVHRLGFVHQDDLVAIYNLATVYCQPSLYEGFGLPVLEAMACGTPVVASKTQALVEIAGRAALYVDPEDSKSIAQGLKKMILSDKLKNEYSKKGLQNAKDFNWDESASHIIKFYKSIISS